MKKVKKVDEVARGFWMLFGLFIFIDTIIAIALHNAFSSAFFIGLTMLNYFFGCQAYAEMKK
jgi:hypothetical protein